MGSFAPKGHAKVDPRGPNAFAICDCCGFQYNHNDLKWQMQWYGTELRKTGFLHCPTCYDVPSIQRPPPYPLPADPVPILNPRTENPVGGTLNLEDGSVMLQETIVGSSGNEIMTELP